MLKIIEDNTLLILELKLKAMECALETMANDVSNLRQRLKNGKN